MPGDGDSADVMWPKGAAHAPGRSRRLGCGARVDEPPSCAGACHRRRTVASDLGVRPLAAMKLPGDPYISYEHGALFIEDCEVASLAREHGTPLYAYSRASMLAALEGYERGLGGRDHLVCYAVKANSSLAVLKTFVDAGCGFDIVSGGELSRVLAAGAEAGKVVFSGVGKTRGEMRQALDAGVLCFNVESEEELLVLSAVAVDARSVARVSLRVNPDVDARTHPYISTGLKGNKFGIAHDEALKVYRRAAALPGIEVVGLDCHIGSQITSVEPYLDALDRMLDLVETVEAAGIAIHHLDLGGGLGITYTDETPPDPTALMQRLLQRIDARGHGQRRLLVEPGRSLVGNAGILVSEVLYMKPGAEKNFCIIDAAMNDLVRPAMYDAWMAIVPALQHSRLEPVRCDVVGPICESGDWLGRDRELAVAAGDFVAVLSAGAYAMSMASNYNSRGRAAEVMVCGDQAALIRRRETPAAMLEEERLALSALERTFR